MEQFKSADQFEQWYARRSGTSVEWMRSMGRQVKSCDCGESFCSGWGMTHADAGKPCNCGNNQCLGWQLLHLDMSVVSLQPPIT